MYDLRAPLKDLLKRGRKWIWLKECEDAFQKIKSHLFADLSLAHFDSKKEIIVASDASNYGIREVILHKFKRWDYKAYSPYVPNSTSHRKKRKLGYNLHN